MRQSSFPLLLFLTLLTLLALTATLPATAGSSLKAPLQSSVLYLPTVYQTTVMPGETVLIPAGNFLMGCDTTSDACLQEELPQHTVFLNAYRIDKYEVTVGQYALCVADGVCNPPMSFASYSRPSYYDNPDYAKFPVIHVSWLNAEEYCAWAGKRLPSEAEWEKAARGPSPYRIYPWGSSVPDCNRANYSWSNDMCVGDTTEVGTYPAGVSPYGVYDLAGNVYEWVNDWYNANYYAGSPSRNPAGPASGQYKVVRGGAFNYNWSTLRAARRGSWYPDDGLSSVGFRCASAP